MTTALALPLRRQRAPRQFIALLPAIAMPLVGLALGWRGGDLAAQVFRADMFRNSGLTVWNNLWFAVLTPVLTKEHWHVWRVSDSHGYIDGPGRIVSMTTSKLVVEITRPGTITIHVHCTPRWSTTATGCVTLAPMNWTPIQVATAGRYTIQPAWFPKKCALEE